ncbi:multidrug efflux pump subunit AcrB [Sinobacterium caligoides]|uniref:Multidrug efflux pump subunit AcrB n=1 Tax=Sinobacterium caligoides TaxID=933926 RepID=A0A3N2E090_9GAMM|nr:efflux RND transporter permease subunit [Sinobacterium caligoides]ROS05504.1 multidrug efflux pump subunit AcrB [Sinobacterium caligoides]
MNFIFNYRKAIIALCVLLFFFGFSQVSHLPISLFPKSTKPTIRVTVPHDMDVLELKNDLGRKIESSLLNIEDIEQVDAMYSSGVAKYILKFSWNKPANVALNETTAVVSFFQTHLPDYLPKIKVDYIDSGIENYVAIKSDVMSANDLSVLVESKLKPVLSNIKGLHKSFISKVNREEVRVEINPYALIRHGIKFSELLEVLNNARFNVSLGTIRGNQTRPDKEVFYLQSVKSIEQLKSLVVGKDNDDVIRLQDVADIKLAVAENGRSYYVDERAVVALAAWPRPNTNLYEFSKEFQTIIAEELRGIGDVVILNDPLLYINESLKKVFFAVLLSMLFCAVSVLLAFRSMSLVMLISCIIPCSLLASVLLLQIFNVGLNIVSLAAMSVSCGLVIDNAVVVVDSICQKARELNPLTKNDFVNCVLSSVKESSKAVISASMTTLVVFLPLAFTHPVVYSLIGELSLVVVAVIIFSIILSLFFLPSIVLSFAYFTGRWEIFLTKSESSISISNRVYSLLLNSILRSKSLQLLLVGIFVILCGYSVSLLNNNIRKEIVAEPHPNIIDVELSFFSKHYNQEFRESLLLPIRQQVVNLTQSQVRYVFTDMRPGVAYISLHLKDYRLANQVMEDLKASLKDTKYYNVHVTPWVSAKLTAPKIPDYRILVYGLNESNVRDVHKSLVFDLKNMSEVKRVKFSPKSNLKSEFHVLPNQSLVQTIGMPIPAESLRTEALGIINHALEPQKLFDVKFEDGERPLFVLFDEQHDINSLKNIPISINNQVYALRNLVKIEESQEWSDYYSRNGQDIFLIEIWFNLSRADEIVSFLDQQFKKHKVDGVKFIVQDTQGEIWQSIRSLVIALVTAIALVVVVLLISNNSITYTLVSLTTIPMGFVGATIALYVFNSTLSVNSLIGLLILTGLSINNAILITHKFKLILESEDISLKVAIVRAATSRLRAMFVTSTSTVLGMVPIAMGLGSNGNIMQPLGISLGAGLLVSFLLGLLLVPILLYWAECYREESGTSQKL